MSRPCPIRPATEGRLGAPLVGSPQKKVRRLPFVQPLLGITLPPVAWHCWEMAMSELKQQTIALWILLMLLLMVPWILE
jgi:hypothetical protein